MPCRNGGRARNRFAYLGDGFTKRKVKNSSIGDAQTLNYEDYWRICPAIRE